MKKELSLKNKTLISVILFVIVFAGLLTVATLYDFQISKILTKNALPSGNYFSSNGFGLFFEAIGSAPIWIMSAIAGCIFFWCAVRNNKKFISVIMAILVFGAIYLFVSDIFNYIGEHMGNEDFMKKLYVMLLEAVLALIISGLLILEWGHILPETNKKLFKWGFVILLSVASYLIITIIKAPVGRMRYRSMNATGDFSGYTAWYVINGKRTIEGLPNDSCKSFPSGHTFGAGIIYTLLCLPYLLEKFNKKGVKVALWIITISYTGIVAISRIIVGAHYMSDVLFGGTIAFLSVMLFRELIICKNANIKALFSKKKPDTDN